MTQDVQFATLVRQKAPSDIPSPHVQQAIDHYVETGKVHRGEVPDAIKLARSYADIAVMPEVDEDEDRRVSSLAMAQAETVIVSELLLEELIPEVEDLRTKLFGAAKPPFLDYAAAVSWIEREVKKGKPDHSAEESMRLSEQYLKEFNDFADRWQAIYKHPTKLQPERLALRFASPKHGRVIAIPYWDDSRIGPIHEFVERASRRTGFSEHDLVAYVLSGIPPIVPDITVGSTTFFNSGRSPEIRITVRKPNVSWADMRRAYASIKQEQGKGRSYVLTPVEQAIISTMTRLGGRPYKGKQIMEFWERVSKELVKLELKIKWSAIRVRYGRLKKRVDSRLLKGAEQQPGEG